MLDAFIASNNQKYLNRAVESANWYVKALRSDGGLFRATLNDFKTSSFGHATSGSASAASFLYRLATEFNLEEYFEPMELALNFCVKMQLTNTKDPNLSGVILEKVNFPCGSDDPPYHVRDLGSIFFIQAAASYIKGNH